MAASVRFGDSRMPFGLCREIAYSFTREEITS
jgi:hypothetical protein